MSAPAVKVTDHALQRYRERIDPLASEAEAVAVLTGHAVCIAASFGARVVRLERGRIILEFTAHEVVVITVLLIWPNLPQALLPPSRGGPVPTAHLRALFHHQQQGAFA